ncbi:cytochrome b/b6 domain-containing protein [Myxococcota bacterium]|nr:cytochrome b/b6 domain-containing protein [Myxococcota bacterium]
MHTPPLDDARSSPVTPVTPDDRAPIAVWDLPTRVFHWALATAFAGAFLTAEWDGGRKVHVLFGLTMVGLIVFRIVWGFVGTRYARFRSFVFPPGRVASYLRSILARAPEHHVGHNPGAAAAIFLMLGLGLVTAASGLATYREVGGEWLEEAHETAAFGLLALVVVHVAGVLLSSFQHRENLVRSMFTGVKLGRAGEGIAGGRVGIGLALLFAVLGFWSAGGTGALDVGALAGPKAAGRAGEKAGEKDAAGSGQTREHGENEGPDDNHDDDEGPDDDD